MFSSGPAGRLFTHLGSRTLGFKGAGRRSGRGSWASSPRAVRAASHLFAMRGRCRLGLSPLSGVRTPARVTILNRQFPRSLAVTTIRFTFPAARGFSDVARGNGSPPKTTPALQRHSDFRRLARPAFAAGSGSLYEVSHRLVVLAPTPPGGPDVLCARRQSRRPLTQRGARTEPNLCPRTVAIACRSRQKISRDFPSGFSECERPANIVPRISFFAFAPVP